MNRAARVLRGAAASGLLRRFDIDPKRYWLLMDLFAQLSERREMFGQLGRNAMHLKSAAYMYFAMMGLLAAVLVFSRPPASVYFWMFQGISALLLFVVLMPETANSLVNPDEAMVLAHQPVNGATYNAAKLSHLLRIVLFLVPGINGVAAVGGIFLSGGGLWFPLRHLGTALLVGVGVALFCCAIFGWLIRFVPAPRLKGIGMLAAALPMVFIAIPKGSWIGRLSVAPQYRVPLAAVLGTAALIGLVVGLRSLSGDYLTRVAAIKAGRSTRAKPAGRAWVAVCVAWLAGGQAARAGFAYAKLMARRDMQFRMQMLQIIPVAAIMGFQVFRASNATPFSEQFAPVHILPHVYALVSLLLCLALPFGSEHKAVWVFQTFPSAPFDRFARGVLGALWVGLVLTPHIVLLPVFIYQWNVWDGLMFSIYGGAFATLYLGLGLRLARGIPFSKPAETTRSDVMMPILMVGGIVIAAMVLVQWLVVFRSHAVVLAATVALGIGAWMATRASLRALTASMRFQLSTLGAESKQIYTEVDL